MRSAHIGGLSDQAVEGDQRSCRQRVSIKGGCICTSKPVWITRVCARYTGLPPLHGRRSSRQLILPCARRSLPSVPTSPPSRMGAGIRDTLFLPWVIILEDGGAGTTHAAVLGVIVRPS
jgi:hypothetical protein